jgi:hypothetical protein
VIARADGFDIGDYVSLAASAAAVLLFAAAVARAASSVWRRTFGARREASRKVSLLACGVGRRYVEQLLGAPAFHTEGEEIHEDVYVLTTGYVQTLSALDGTVLRYSVTATDPRWRPKLGQDVVERRNGRFGIRLCKARFADMAFTPEELELSSGARLVWYRERYYYGNPGYYQQYIFSFSSAGTWKYIDFESMNAALEGAPDITLSSVGESARPVEDLLKQPALAAFRANTRINTYTVVGPYDRLADLEQWSLGPNPDLVRILPGKLPRRHRMWRLRVWWFRWQERRRMVALSSSSNQDEDSLDA